MQTRKSVNGSKTRQYGRLDEKKDSLGVLIKLTILNRKISKDSIFFAVALDIGSHGMLIESDKIMSVGEKVKCTFILRHKVNVAGEIVKEVQAPSGVFRYEVKFFDVDPNILAQMKEMAGQR